VLIVDEFTGRVLLGRRYNEGMHQAIEAKEHVEIKAENQTLATITLQNYFRMYDKLAGMTGTAVTEDQEFREIYSLAVIIVPTNMPMVRDDRNALIYRNVDAKFGAVADEVAERSRSGQPCLVGTISIENSERLSRLLMKRGIEHETLNAKQHEREAHIVAQAGRKGAVTIATNMAGRGTDIVLGGNPEFTTEEVLISKGVTPEEATEEQEADALKRAEELCKIEHIEVVDAGGLAVIGTERHESRRIDNQLRGRSGRQGDPGLSQFYLSLEDDLMRLFGGNRMERVSNMMEKTSVPEDMPIQAGLVSKAIAGAQQQVEAMNFGARKHVLEYDDIMNKQREVIYAERNRILDGKDIHSRVEEMLREIVGDGVLMFCNEDVYSEEWDWDGLVAWYRALTGLDGVSKHKGEVENPHELADDLTEEALAAYSVKESEVGDERLRALERQVMLRVIDTKWMEHLQEMDYLKEGIGLRAMGQRDPIVEYKSEAYEMFSHLVASINEDFLRTIMHIQVVAQTPAPEQETPKGVSYSAPSEQSIFTGAMEAASQAGVGGPSPEAIEAAGKAAGGTEKKSTTVVKDKEDPYANVGRNDLCPCGSGKKYKKCHGANA